MGPDGLAKMKPTPPYNWHAWIFDLDDTLLDTSNSLIPDAVQRACQFMVAQGVTPSLEECLSLWSERHRQATGIDLWKILSNEANQEKKERIAIQAYDIFRRPILPDTLPLMTGGGELLRAAYKRFPLFLITQGDLETQLAKVRKLKIAPYFQRVYYLDPFKGENKQDAFINILQTQAFKPQHLLSIGNRRDNEIAIAKRLGMTTCLIRYGEHAHEDAQSPEEIPDFEIDNLHELVRLLDKGASQ